MVHWTLDNGVFLTAQDFPQPLSAPPSVPPPCNTSPSRRGVPAAAPQQPYISRLDPSLTDIWVIL